MWWKEGQKNRQMDQHPGVRGSLHKKEAFVCRIRRCLYRTSTETSGQSALLASSLELFCIKGIRWGSPFINFVSIRHQNQGLTHAKQAVLLSYTF